MPGARGATGAAGPRGPPGDAGRAGESGPAGLRVSLLLNSVFFQRDLMSVLVLSVKFKERIGPW